MKITPIAQKWRNQGSALWAAAGKSFAETSQRMGYSGENLIISISNTLAIHKRDVREAKTLIGRFLELITKPIDPDNIKLDGTRPMQLFDLAQSKPPIKLSASGGYNVDLLSFVELLSKAKEHLQKD
ncbi:MAG: hypothetical protein JKX91_01225 [Rhizobiaceae bacterium]|nr:hypothetical protein [Rhizobiaceae bacterium]